MRRKIFNSIVTNEVLKRDFGHFNSKNISPRGGLQIKSQRDAQPDEQGQRSIQLMERES